MSETTSLEELKQLATVAIRRAETHARDYYSCNLPGASIDFSLRGRCAGQACLEQNNQTSLRINLKLLAENTDDFLLQTIPHEVAHLVVNWQARKKRVRPRPHGIEWQAVMQACFGLEPRRCHSYETTPARVVARPFFYRCHCRQHHLTSIMHKRISRGDHALCKQCKAPLQFISKEATS
jgi:SprT protein